MQNIDHGSWVIVDGWNLAYTVVARKNYFQNLGVEIDDSGIVNDDIIWVNNSGANFIYGSPEDHENLIVLKDGEIVTHSGMKFEVRANDPKHYEPISFIYIPPEYE